MNTKFKLVLFAITFTLTGLSLTAGAQDVHWLNEAGALSAAERALKHGNFDRAEDLLHEAMEQPLPRGQRLRALNDLCVTDYMQGQYEAALRWCSRALEIKAGHWQALLNRGNAHLALKDFAAAEQDYLAALEIRPRNDILKQNLALARRSSANAN